MIVSRREYDIGESRKIMLGGERSEEEKQSDA
jgi:hypothetical protein